VTQARPQVDGLPKRIVCLTEEPTEVLYALGESARIAGISGFTVRPPQARRKKPRVSAFTSAKIDAILALAPDLAIGFSDMHADPEEVVRAAPDIIIGSWCGKRFRAEKVAARPRWAGIPAVRNGELHETKSPIILQPGPAALTDGLDALQAIVRAWARRDGARPPV
jgi:ABC-type Fe3+-hydroxamate transport system substrate-binding protein